LSWLLPFLFAATLLAGSPRAPDDEAPCDAEGGEGAALFLTPLQHTCRSPIAIGGYDVVAYRSLEPGEPGVEGSRKHCVDFEGASFLFVSCHHARLFRENPRYYIPQYGGFCAYGIAFEYVPLHPWLVNSTLQCLGPPGEPKTGWAIYKDRLYLSINKERMDEFMESTEGVAVADARWTVWFGRADAPPFNSDCIYPEPLYKACGDRVVAMGCCDLAPELAWCQNQTRSSQ